MSKTALSGGVAIVFLATVCIDAQRLSGPIARAVAQAAAEIDRNGATGIGRAQPSTGDAEWERMRGMVPVGSAVLITLPDRVSVRGTLRATDEASLTIAVAASDRRVTRRDVLRVSVPSGTHRQRKMNIGMAIGAVAAGIVMFRRCPFRDNVCNEESVVYYLPLIAGGAAVGAWLPPGTAWRQIYGRPAP
jgi:hypothetical protein